MTLTFCKARSMFSRPFKVKALIKACMLKLAFGYFLIIKKSEQQALNKPRYDNVNMQTPKWPRYFPPVGARLKKTTFPAEFVVNTTLYIYTLKTTIFKQKHTVSKWRPNDRFCFASFRFWQKFENDNNNDNNDKSNNNNNNTTLSQKKS